MDVFSEVLRVVRLEGALFFNAEFSAPWCISTATINRHRTLSFLWSGAPDPPLLNRGTCLCQASGWMTSRTRVCQHEALRSDQDPARSGARTTAHSNISAAHGQLLTSAEIVPYSWHKPAGRLVPCARRSAGKSRSPTPCSPTSSLAAPCGFVPFSRVARPATSGRPGSGKASDS
jgi:hypothetical protein